MPQTLTPEEFAAKLGGQIQTQGLDPDALAAKLGGSVTTSESTQPSAASRFASNLGDQLIVEPIKGIYGLGKNIVQEAARGNPAPVSTTVGNILTNIATASWEQLRQAKDAIAQGRYWDAAKRVGEAVPLVGPTAAGVVRQAKTGDVAGALGSATGIAASFALPEAAGLSKARVASEAAVPLTIAERTGSKLAAYGENIVERTVPAAGTFERFRALQQKALAEMADRVALDVGGRQLEAGEVGNAIQKGLDIGGDLAKRNASIGYRAIDEAVQSTVKRVPKIEQVPSTILGPNGEALTVPKRTMVATTVGGVQPSTAVLRQAAIPILRRLKTEAQLIPPEQLASVRQILERVVNAPKTLPFEAFQDARSDLLDITRRHTELLPGKSTGVVRLLAEKADEAMMTAAEQSGIPKLPELIRETNQRWRDMKTTYNDRYITKIAQASPEKVPALIRTIDMDDLALLKRAVPKVVFDQARAHVMRDIIAESISGSTGGRPNLLQLSGVNPAEGRPVFAPEHTMSGARMKSALYKMGSEKTQALFGADAQQALIDIADLADRIGTRGPKGPTRGLIPAGINAGLFASLYHPFDPRWIGTGAATAATLNIAAKILTNPEGLLKYRDFLQAVSKGNRPVALALGTQLSAMLNKPEMSPMPSHVPTAAAK